ncbi:hypothetical protein F7725_007625 [Dissostichus mawsoni]|uniref:Calpain-3/13-like C-terminal EF-hand domain-containing protein n=1 Tax=Dissostichus mawsoni TaxID=36200 RepID=A0A7J5Y4X7_DISMA|nr:hypothetical protein F7725_007625 [Dissostichus mawsoni]
MLLTFVAYETQLYNLNIIALVHLELKALNVLQDKGTENEENDENKTNFFRQYSDKYEEVDAEQLQRLLNENILKDINHWQTEWRGIYSPLEEGRQVQGKNNQEKVHENQIELDSFHIESSYVLTVFYKTHCLLFYQDIFFRTDVSKTGTLLLGELRNAVMASGKRVSDDMLNLLALRYGASSGHITLESFISMVLRFDCMSSKYRWVTDDAKQH